MRERKFQAELFVAQTIKTHLFNLYFPFDAKLRAEHNGRMDKTQQCQEGLPGYSKKEKSHEKTRFRTTSLAPQSDVALPKQNRAASTVSLHTGDNDLRKACPCIRKSKIRTKRRKFARCHSQRNVLFRPSDAESRAEHNGPTHERQRGQEGLPGHSKTKFEW